MRTARTHLLIFALFAIPTTVIVAVTIGIVRSSATDGVMAGLAGERPRDAPGEQRQALSMADPSLLPTGADVLVRHPELSYPERMFGPWR